MVSAPLRESDTEPTFTTRLSDPRQVCDAVESVRSLGRRLDDLIDLAEDDLLSYYNLHARRFVRETADVSRPSPPDNPSSNAHAVIALETAQATAKAWPRYRPHVLENLATMRRVTEGLSPDNTFTNPRIAVALSCYGHSSLADTQRGSPLSSRNWPEAVLDSISRYGGIAIESLNSEPRPHPEPTYWALRAILEHQGEIRARYGDIDRCLQSALAYCASSLYRLHASAELDGLDVVSYAFALATIWHTPDRLERTAQMVDPTIQHEIEKQALGRVMRAQRSRGHWRAGHPLWRTSNRNHIYAFPVDLLYVLFERVPALLKQKRIKPDSVLSATILTGLNRFCDWATSEHHPAVSSLGQIAEAALPCGWANSSQAGAQEPES